MKRYLVLAFMGLALSAAPAFAQVSVYGGGGSAIGTGEDMEDVDAGLQLLGGLVVDVTDRVGIYAEGQWGRHDVTIEGVTDPTATPSALMAGLLLGLSSNEDAAISPYVFGGVGLQSLELEGEEGGETESADDRTFGWQAGAGFGFDIGSLPAFLEGRYQRASFDEDSEFEELDFAIFSIIFGFSFDFGGDN